MYLCFHAKVFILVSCLLSKIDKLNFDLLLSFMFTDFVKRSHTSLNQHGTDCFFIWQFVHVQTVIYLMM